MLLDTPVVAAGSSRSSGRLAPQARLVLGAAAACLLLLVAASFVWFFGWNSSTPDVTAYWRAGMHFRLGEPLYGPPPPGISPKAFLYPPAFAVLFSALTLLSPVTGYAAWMALHFAFLGALLIGCMRLADLRTPPMRLRYVALLVLWLPASVGGDFQEGQINLLVACLVVIGLLWIEEERPVAGGAMLALAVHLKLLPVVLFAVLLLQRRTRAVAAGAAAAAALVLLPAVVTIPREGIAAGLQHAITLHLDFVRVVLAPAATDARVVGDEQFYVLNNSLVAVLHRLFGEGVAFSPFPELASWHGPLLFVLPRPLLRLASAGAGATLVGAALVFARRTAMSRTGRVAAFGMAIAAIELATLNCWEHHLVFLALLLAPLAATDLRQQRTVAATSLAVAAVWTGPYMLDPLAGLFGNGALGVLLATSRTWGFPTLAILLLMLAMFRSPRLSHEP